MYFNKIILYYYGYFITIYNDVPKTKPPNYEFINKIHRTTAFFTFIMHQPLCRGGGRQVVATTAVCFVHHTAYVY